MPTHMLHGVGSSCMIFSEGSIMAEFEFVLLAASSTLETF